MNIKGLETKGVEKKFWVLEFWVVHFSLQGCDTVLLGKCLLTSERIWCLHVQGQAVQGDSTCTTQPCIWRCHNPLKLCNHSPRSTASHPRVPESTSVSLWGLQISPVSSYRTLICVRGFPVFVFNLSRSVLRYYILSNSWDLTLFSACSNFIFSMSCDTYANFTGIISQVWVTFCYGCHLVTAVRLTAI